MADGTEAEFTFQDVTKFSSLCIQQPSSQFEHRSGCFDRSSGTVPFPKACSLSAGSRYEYAFVATNNGGAAQSNTNSFVTLGLPQVLTPGATDVTKTSVTINADLNSTGGVSYQSGEPFSGSTAPRHADVDGWK